MSWDTAKAFDSVGNHIQYAAWRRMGIPENISSWVMNLDWGESFVTMLSHTRKTPDAIKMSGPQDTSHQDTSLAGFIPARGFMQGDVKSPIAWSDMFLRHPGLWLR
jgi:hypothetical protein